MAKPPTAEKETVGISTNTAECPALSSDFFQREAELQRLLHELQVNQINLEMRNEELLISQQELESSRARYFELYDQAPVSYITLNEQGIVLEANLTAATLLGVERAALVNQPFSRYILPEDQVICSLHRKQLLETGTSHTCELRMLKPAGGQFWVKVEAIAAQDKESGEPVFKVVVSDITESKRVELKLLEVSQFSGQVINSAQEGVIVYDLDLRYRVWNPYMEKMTGMMAADVQGRHPAELFPFLKESGLIERLERVLSGETPSAIDYQYTVPQTGKSGWTSNVSAPLLNTKGEIIGIIATIREITERKRMENELRQALETAEAVNVTMNRLLRIIAHEFRSPLGVLTGSTDILDLYWDRLTPEKRFELHEHIRNAARQLSHLVSSVVAFNLLGTDRFSHPLKVLNIGEICSAISAEVETAWGVGHKCTVTIAPDSASALLDEVLFRRTVENLLTNAFRYTPSGGTVSFHVRRDKNRLCLEISDTGIGIPEEDQTLVFDAFYRCRNVEGRGGLGLGLSIVRESLSQMGGTITVISRTGEGTTMRVEIPVADPAQY